MADKDDKKPAEGEAAGEEGAAKKKSPLMMIILIFAGALVLVGGSVGATLFLTGFFDPKPTPEEIEAAKAAEEAAAATQVPEGPQRETKDIPAEQRFEATYSPVERDFTLNVPNSRRFVQFRIAFKTFYGEQIVERVAKHQIAIEASIIQTMGFYGEEELTSMEGRTRVAAALRDSMNDVLIRNEDFGGIEEVMFTHFVFQ